MGPTLAARLNQLCDANTLMENVGIAGSVYFTGRAEIDGRSVVIIAADPDPLADPPDLKSSMAGYVKALQQADSHACPVVFLHDSPALYQSGRTAFQGVKVDLMLSENGVGRQYYEIGRLKGRVPLVSAVFGHLAQAQAFPALMGDAVVMLEESSISVARPDAVEAMLGEKVSYKVLGGAGVHSRTIGDCDEVVRTEAEAIAWIKNFLSYVPLNHNESVPVAPPVPISAGRPGLEKIIPKELNLPFDARQVVEALVDSGQFLEKNHKFAEEIVTGLGRVNGRAVGIAANNPRVRGGVLFPESCRKLVRFISFCDSFNLPLVFLADAPGFMIGQSVEKNGIVSAGAELFQTIAQTKVPRLCIILRRAYTAGLYAMSGSGFSPQGLYLLPDALLAVYGPEAVDRFLVGLDLPPQRKEEIRAQMIEDSRPESLLERGLISGIIEADAVRPTIAGFLEENGD